MSERSTMLTGLISKQDVAEHGNIKLALKAQLKTILPTWEPVIVATSDCPYSAHYLIWYDLIVPGTKYRFPPSLS